VLTALEQDPAVELILIASGMHLSPEFGHTVDAIIADGFDVSERVEMTLSTDTPTGVAKSIGLGVIGFSEVFSRQRPDIVVVLGDRYEMLAAASAALPHMLPLAHLHGGEATEGLIDEAIRHSITKMSHIHFVSTDVYRRRVEQLGEEPWRVVLSGAPGLDNLRTVEILSPDELARQHSLDLDSPVLLVTFHPVTLQYERTAFHVQELLAALEACDEHVVFTYPNADTHGRVIIDAIRDFVACNPRAQCAVNLGTQGYCSLLRHAKAMIGNSSSGIIEAATYELPVVNIGDRQRGRVHGRNVIVSKEDRESILQSIRKAVDPQFRDGLNGMKNPYGDGHAAEAIVARLKSVELNEALLLKRFRDLPIEAQNNSISLAGTK